MALAQRIGRSRRRLILLALTAITLLTLDLRGFGPLGTAQGLLRDGLHPVADAVLVVVSPFADAWNGVVSYDDLQAENLRLQAEIARIEGEALSVEAERAAFAALLEATGIGYVDSLETVAATVVGNAPGNFGDHTVVIDRGRSDGISEGMAVVTGRGMVGRVDRVDRSTAAVQLITDPSLAISARVVSNGEVGLGRADGELWRISEGISHPAAGVALPEVGSVVVTAAASRYPPEIPIGRVVAVAVDDALSTVTVDVQPSNDVADLGYVSVILAEGVDEMPLRDLDPETPDPPAADLDTVDPAADAVPADAVPADSSDAVPADAVPADSRAQP